MRWILLGCCLLTPLLEGKAADSPLAIERVLWGFTGTPDIESFNLLTIEVSNVSKEPYQGAIQLEKRFGNSLSGVPEIQSVSLAPGGKRIVQFTPYLEHAQHADWRVSWRGGREDLEDIPYSSKQSPYQGVVEMSSPNWLLEKSRTSFPRFPEHYFPTNASATVGLKAVILSHAPNWDAPRAEAFLQWLNRDGTLHLFPGPDGETLRFEGTLATLNQAIRVGSLGQGKVIQHQTALATLKATDLNQLLHTNNTSTPRNDQRNAVWRAFGQTTLPDVSWSLVYLAAFVYLALIGPGHYLYARAKKRDYRLIIVTLLACIGAFSWLFSMIGRHAYSDSGKWLSASIAYPIGDGTYDVEQWAHAFVTKGNSYDFRFGESKALFSVQHQNDRVPGFLRGGSQGYLQLDLPLNSSRNLISRAALSGPEIHVDLTTWIPSSNDIRAMVTSDIDILKMWLRTDGQYTEMELEDGLWITSFRDHEILENQQYHYFGKARKRDIDDMNDDLQKWLVTRLSETHEQHGPASEHAQLLIWGKTPESFRPTSPSFDAYDGRVLYVVPLANLPKPTDP